MNSELGMAKYRGVLIDEGTASLFRLAERELRKAIKSGNYGQAQDLLTEVKLNIDDDETLQQLFEELRKDTTEKWTRKHGPIKQSEVIVNAVADFCDARTRWYFTYVFGLEDVDEDSFAEAIQEATAMDAQLKPIANASDAIFLPVFDQLNQYAQEAWVEMYKAEQRLHAAIRQFCID